MFRFPPILILGAAVATPALAGPLDLSTRITAEARVRLPDGSTRIDQVPPTRAVPGDRMTVTLAYRNTGAQPIGDLVLANPVPRGLAYRGPAPGSPEPEVSTDGQRFAALAALDVAAPAGRRAATADDVTHVRWRLTRPVAAGTAGTLSFRAVLK